MKKSILILIYGPNGAGKTTIARALATKYRGLHIQIDLFSSMARGKFWHTHQNSKDKMAFVLAVLDAAVAKTKYCRFFLDGVLIYRFMFDVLEDWCNKYNIHFIPIYLTGEILDLNYRIKMRGKLKKNFNNILPEIYEHFYYRQAIKVNSSRKSSQMVIKEIERLLK